MNSNIDYNLYSTDYNPVSQKLFPAKTYKHKEQRQFKKYILEKEINLETLSTSISFCKQVPTLVSIFSETDIYVYDIISKKLQTKFTKISDNISYGTIRDDGKVILTGTTLGKIYLHDTNNKICLRQYNAHSLEITSFDIDSSLVRFVSASKDCSFKVFDMATITPKATYSKAHNDYIQIAKYVNDNVILTGGYDKVIKLWDINDKKNEVIFDNENICEDILILNDKNYFLATSDNGIYLYDIRNNKEKVKQIYPIQSTIKRIITNEDNSRLFISAPNESFIKVLNLKYNALNYLYSLNFKNKVLNFDISNNINYYAYANENNELIIKAKNLNEKLDEKNGLNYDKEDKDIELLIPANYAEKAIIKNYKYFNRGQYSKNISDNNEITVPKTIKKHLKEFDKKIKQFKFQESLDSVISTKNVDQILGVIEELIDRNVLKLALMNRNEDEVETVLNFILWKIRDSKSMGLLIYVFDLMIDLYSIVIMKNEKIKNLFQLIHNEIKDEIIFQNDLNSLNSQLNTITTLYDNLI